MGPLPGSALCPSFRRSAGAELVRQDARFGLTILDTGDSHLKHQLQVTVFQKRRPVERDFGIHARLESIPRAKDHVLIAHHSGLAETLHRS
jgi:hypothetical protein